MKFSQQKIREENLIRAKVAYESSAGYKRKVFTLRAHNFQPQK